MFEIYTFYENMYEICTFYEIGYKICIFMVNLVPIFVKSVISNILSMVDELTIRAKNCMYKSRVDRSTHFQIVWQGLSA